jgi:transcriptional regulator with XRE-family HTH domain
MSKSLRSPGQQALQRLLADARVSAGLTQAQLAERLNRPQSFVAKYEIGERRLDVIEFCAVARGLDQEPVALLLRLLEHTNA